MSPFFVHSSFASNSVGNLANAICSPLKACKEPRGVEVKSAAELEALWQKEEEEKRKQEEERKKEEEEKRQQEEEEKVSLCD